MIHNTYTFRFSDLDITKTQLLDILGQDDDFISSVIDDLMAEAATVADIKAEFRVFENIRFNEADKTLSVDDQSFNIGNTIYAQLKKAEAVAFFLCTAGPGPGQRSHEAMQEGDPLKSFVLDAIASEIVEETGIVLLEKMEKIQAESGKKVSGSFSPGYCGWDVAEQHKLFRFFPDNFCGITLTSSALMTPVKSASGIIGIGNSVKKHDSPCSFCDLRDCVYREARARKIERMGS